MSRRPPLALVLAALLAGCADEPPPCLLAVLRDDGWVPVVEATEEPLTLPAVRPVICLHGVVPCGDEAREVRSSSTSVVRVYRDAVVPWVWHLAAVAPGTAMIHLDCREHGVHSVPLEVR